ncbi:MAG: helix-turn-helix domain-containing protein [Bacteroidota bacterium]
MKITFFSLIYLFGAAQAGLLLLGINWTKPFLSDTKKIISLLLLAMMIAMVYYVLVVNAYSFPYPFFNALGSAAWMAIAPLYYLLNLNILLPKWQLTSKHLAYGFFPLLFIAEGLFNTVGLPWPLYYLLENAAHYLDFWMLSFFGTGFYFIIKCVFLHQGQEAEEGAKNQDLKWFTYAFLLVLVIFAMAYVFIRSDYLIHFELILIALFEAFVFLLVYKIFKFFPFHHFFDTNKYSNKTLSKEQLQKYAQQLENIMNAQQPFLDQKLSLNDLSKISSINSNDLSQVFKLYYQSNFYDFINRYRLIHLENLILDPSYQQYKIMALAEKSGFNSKATFYKVFKEKHQLTPTQFIKDRKAN